jgi:hypothetical protein
MIIFGKWLVLKSYEGTLKAGEEFTKVFFQRNPREIGEYRFTFCSSARPSFDIETYGTHLIKDGYVAWIPPYINDVQNEDVKGQLGAILADDSQCNPGTMEYLYTLCPLEATVWPYLAGHDVAHYYLPEVAKRSKETARPFFTKLYHEKIQPLPSHDAGCSSGSRQPHSFAEINRKAQNEGPHSSPSGLRAPRFV